MHTLMHMHNARYYWYMPYTDTRTPVQPSLSLGKAAMGAREGAEELREAGRGGGGQEESATRGNK